MRRPLGAVHRIGAFTAVDVHIDEAWDDPRCVVPGGRDRRAPDVNGLDVGTVVDTSTLEA
jgi:hypothetical protein